MGLSSVNDETKELRSCLSVHVPADRKSQEVEHRRNHVDDRRAGPGTTTGDRSAIRQEETIRRSFVCAVQVRIADEAFEGPFCEAHGFHAVTGHDQQKVVRTD